MPALSGIELKDFLTCLNADMLTGPVKFKLNSNGELHTILAVTSNIVDGEIEIVLHESASC